MSGIIKKMKRSTKIAVLRKLSDQGNEKDAFRMTPSERILSMWQLALDSWSFSGRYDAKSGFQRHIVTVMRRAS